ncbi:MAG: NAD(P)-dependent oxidoreductase [Candidatus Latescibacterota bacterium]|nr:NAD(P)-dependent oxidoreductase [Candidatus Latescibacterota bacterium]
MMSFRVAFTADFLKPGSIDPVFPDIDIRALDVFGVEHEILTSGDEEIVQGQLADFDAVVVLGPRVSVASLEGAEHLAVVARIGVGYDSVDVDACTRESVALTITPDGVRRPVASAALTFLLALSHKLLMKDRLTREGRWGEKAEHMGIGLRGRTLGFVGMGNIGREILRLTEPLDMDRIVADPYADAEHMRRLGVEIMGLPTVLDRADFVIICCALNDDTHHLIGEAELKRMKKSAHLINVARGPIVNQKALTTALQEGHIAGAALDVFEEEPVDSNEPLLQLDNVIASPHALSWTDESFRMMGESAFAGILAASEGREPHHVVNKQVIESERFQAKLAACAERRQRG